MCKFVINHKNKKSMKNNLENLELVSKNVVMRKLTTTEKSTINNKSVCKSNIIREDQGVKIDI